MNRPFIGDSDLEKDSLSADRGTLLRETIKKHLTAATPLFLRSDADIKKLYYMLIRIDRPTGGEADK